MEESGYCAATERREGEGRRPSPSELGEEAEDLAMRCGAGASVVGRSWQAVLELVKEGGWTAEKAIFVLF